ncbi:MAG: FAD-dependent oxidoreductase [Planctomycetaceae bacterium]|nr:FAD-dependent oxidoreductase [Planctomycetaceae bacterium]
MRTSNPLLAEFPVRITQLLILVLAFGRPLWAAGGANQSAPQCRPACDVVIYGATSAGIAAAIQVRRMGHSVVVLEPNDRMGGLTTGGLGQTDIGNKAAIGGISREFYRRIRRHYANPKNWIWQAADDYQSHGQSRSADGEDAMWTFEPSAALAVLQQMVHDHNVTVRYGQALDRSAAGVSRKNGRIVAVRTLPGDEWQADVYIDATYEGDLMAAAGVAFTVGREANADYGETLNGVQTRRAVHHQLVDSVDPWIIPGMPDSGLLPGIDPDGPGEEGGRDHRVQAFCFRMCLTDHPDNRIPFVRPDGYQERDYELLLRNFEAGATRLPWSMGRMPNRKSDVNNNRGVSTDFIGQNYDYPNATYLQRAAIVRRHFVYQQGLMWTLANHPRVPAAIRQEVSRWGTCKDEFAAPSGWQQQLYIREARRMIGSYVMTQHNCQGRTTAPRPVGLAAYTMDSHNVQRYVGPDGSVRNEGDVQVGGFSPYPIDYGALVPRRTECGNLLVPVCLSASHIAFGSIRMEPVFMVLGQSAATAAVLAVEDDIAVQDVDYTKLRQQLLHDRQVLTWTGPVRKPVAGVTAESLDGIVVDDQQAQRTGFETISTSAGPFLETGYRHDSNDGKGQQNITFLANVTTPGRYDVRLAWTAHSNRARRVPVTITQGDTVEVRHVDQTQRPRQAPFETIATLTLTTGEVAIEVSNTGTIGFVIADGVQLIAARD